MAIDPGLPVSQSSTRILKPHAPTDSEHKLHKTGIEKWLPIGCSTADGEGVKVLHTYP